MTARKPGLPACQHITVGRQLADIHNQLAALSATLGGAYPATSKQARAANRAAEAVSQLRSALDDASANELADDAWSTRIYYPGAADHPYGRTELARVHNRHRTAQPD